MRFLLRRPGRCAAALTVLLGGSWGSPAPAGAQAAISCPNPIPVVQENHCKGPGTDSWRLRNYSETVAGFATATSVNLGQDVALKIGRSDVMAGMGRVDISVYRAGWYGGLGARLIPGAGDTDVGVPNRQQCLPMDPATGHLSCENWLTTHIIPGDALPASGVYIVKLRSTDTLAENHIYFTVRDDARLPRAELLHVVPVSSWLAYNNWGGKSLYFDTQGGPNTVAGTGRAVKVSFNRPLDNIESGHNRLIGPDLDALMWVERNGYDTSYTDDVRASTHGPSLRSHRALLITGHAEYWSRDMFLNVRAARDAGVSIMSLSANTAYWTVRYDEAGRSMVCFKTVQGDGSGGSGAVTPNDWGPDGLPGTADDALGLDGVAGTADDHPEHATTTFRDNGAPPGDPNAPPGGRVGPDLPENQLFGVMYVGDNDSRSFPLTVPAGNASTEFAADRAWRNSGLSVNQTVDIGDDLVGWEWDAIPTQAQYTRHQPAGVKRLSDTNVQVASDNSWLQDEGRARLSIPPFGQPGTVQAVRYAASSGARVFASGTIQWAYGLARSLDSRIVQATYNLLSDMNVRPRTPMSGIVLDPAGANAAPVASFTFSPDPADRGQPVRFDATTSADADGLIVRHEWDTDGNGTFETDTGAAALLTRTYESEGEYDVRLRVTDDGGASDVTVRTVTILGARPPLAVFTAAPNPAVTGQLVAFDASSSSDPDGTVVRYEWDLDGDGAYETDTGSTATTSRSYSTTGTIAAGLRVTDDTGKTATATLALTVNRGGVSNYGDAVLDTKGLLHFWRLGESEGTALADTRATAHGTLLGGLLGAPGGPAADPNTAVAFDGVDDAARMPVDLRGLSQITVEFWLKWDAYGDDDRLAMELTDNFNSQAGGFLVDPNAPQFGGTFGVGLGQGTSRNNVFFARPSVGEWHHYAFVLDTTAPAAEQILPYVDGRAVSFSKRDSGTGAESFARATLWLMSRAGTALNGRGTLDEVALYGRALPADVIDEHADSFGTNRRPRAALTATPNPVKADVPVTFDGSGSTDPDGTIQRYEWDLDGNGSFEVDGGNQPRITRTYAEERNVDVRLRVTDDRHGADTEQITLRVGNQAPVAVLTATPDPAITDLATRLDASSSTDEDGQIVRHEWDLDGDGAYETDTGAAGSVTRTYAQPGELAVGLRVTDDGGRTGTTRRPLLVGTSGISRYPDTHLDMPGLHAYWRLGDAEGTSLASGVPGGAAASATGVELGAPGAVAGDPDTAARFGGAASASALLRLSHTRRITVEFWLRWDRYADDDSLAMELTENFDGSDGGFVVDPNAPQLGGTFGVGLGRFDSRNNVFFTRPSAGDWHHYAFVMDTAAPADEQIVPYVDGRPVPYSKLDRGTGAGPFADARLWMMSRAGSSLHGRGDLDEVAVYDRALDAAEIAELYAARGSNRRPGAAFTASPNPQKAGRPITLDASATSDPDGTVVRYQWDLDGDGRYETDGGSSPQLSHTYASAGVRSVRLRVLDDAYGTDTAVQAVTIGNEPPVAAFTTAPDPVTVGAEVTFDAGSSSDPDGAIAGYEWDLDGDGAYETDTGTSPTAKRTYSAPGTLTVRLRVRDEEGETATSQKTLRIRSAPYPEVVLATNGLLSYWRMEEATGTTLADARGISPATTTGGPTLGVPGALPGDGDAAVRFDGVDDAARARVDLSAAGAATVEFWLRWNTFADDDALAMELTPNFNQHDGGLLVDPNAWSGGFAVGIGREASRTAISFARPSAGEWHHLALVLDAAQPAGSRITPYVDGAAVPFTVLAAGEAAPGFADADLHFMSRGATALFGAGDLDELAVYDRALSAATINEHHASGAP